MIFYRHLLPLLMVKHRAAASSMRTQPLLRKEVSQDPSHRKLQTTVDCSIYLSVALCEESPPGCSWNRWAAGTIEEPNCVTPCPGCGCIFAAGACLSAPSCVWESTTNMCMGMPTGSPTASSAPSSEPSSVPSGAPSVSDMPSSKPSSVPSGAPSKSEMPSSEPSSVPSSKPSSQPSVSDAPSRVPSSRPSSIPSTAPSTSERPSSVPSTSSGPTMAPDCGNPTKAPAAKATKAPTPIPKMPAPTPAPTKSPSMSPDCGPPTKGPTNKPIDVQLPAPTPAPTQPPTPPPTASPSMSPDCGPPTKGPTPLPTSDPTPLPTSRPTMSPTTREPTMSPTPLPSRSPSMSPTLTPAEVRGTIFLDRNQNGFQDAGELGLQDILVALFCYAIGSNAGTEVKVADTKTTMTGRYEFLNVVPGRACFVNVESEGYLYGPVMLGGNQLGRDGRSPFKNLKPGQVCETWIGGVFFPFVDSCDGQCGVEVRECGWGVWNKCTCQCDCAPGVCLSSNQQCYDGCTTHEDFNTWGGCRPGVDCPWYPSKLGQSHCESSANFAGIYNLHETAEICCSEHFGNSNINACVQNSVADVSKEEQLVKERLDRPRYYWPDQFGKKNCVFDSGYDDWMVGAMQESYLFSTPQQCCPKWFPSRTDCPNLDQTTPLQLDYKPDVSEQFYYPHLSSAQCRFGRNYPMWYNNSPKHYLYTTPEGCCEEWYKKGVECLAAEDDGVQEGFYWQVDTAYYPNFKGDYCATGNSYPEWMADPMNSDSHLFKTARECCKHWFPPSPRNPDSVTLCIEGVVTVMDGEQVGGPNVVGTWYPSLDQSPHCINGAPPGWMTEMETRDYYVFDSRSECCKAHGCKLGN